MSSRGEIPTRDMFVSHLVGGPFLKFRLRDQAGRSCPFECPGNDLLL
jgi:hypothetical protein